MRGLFVALLMGVLLVGVGCKKARGPEPKSVSDPASVMTQMPKVDTKTGRIIGPPPSRPSGATQQEPPQK
jgi:hypothetical protein